MAAVKNLVLVFVAILMTSHIIAQPYILDVEGQVVIRDFTPALELFDSRPSENRLEGSLYEYFNHIILQSHIGNLIFVADTAGALTQRMSIDAATGSVSISNQFPSGLAKLEVLSENSQFFVRNGAVGGDGLSSNEVLAAEFVGLNNSNPIVRYYGYTPNFVDMGIDSQGNFVVKQNNNLGLSVLPNGNVGVGMVPNANRLSVNGNASKTSAGDWVANSDARLKKNIQPLNSAATLDKMLALKGITYQWNDDKTGFDRPSGETYGFTAQNIQEVFPELVSEDNLGYLQTAYGTYDAMYVECIRALNEKIEKLEAQVSEIDELKKQIEEIKAFQKRDERRKR